MNSTYLKPMAAACPSPLRLVHSGDGRSYGIITAPDITDQKRVQEELREKNALLLERQHQMEQELLRAERVQQSSSSFYFTVEAGAGHPPAIVVRPGESPRLLESTNMILGLFENAVGTESESSVETALASGDRVIVYTDGLTESFNCQREMLRVEGLQEIVAEVSSWPLAEMKQQILHRVAAWCGGHAADDVSLVLLEIF